MDPLSQGVCGAIASQSFVLNKQNLLFVTIIGFLAGMSADLDILIRSSDDPLLYLEYHRQFTHSLIFIPVGGLVCAAIFQLLYFRKHLAFKYTYYYATLGYATHALLDSCTSYGTQLLWPFSHYRVAWNNVSIIDPLFTIPLLMLMVLSLRRKSSQLARLAIAYAIIYLLIGVIQGSRAEVLGRLVAKNNNDTILRITAKPTFGNLLVWKVIYETKDRFHTTGIRIGFTHKIYSGNSVLKLDIKRDFPWIRNGSTQHQDIERFRWFSDGYIAKHPSRENTIADVRYSALPDKIEPIWGIILDPSDQSKHADFENFREKVISQSRDFLKYIRGLD